MHCAKLRSSACCALLPRTPSPRSVPLCTFNIAVGQGECQQHALPWDRWPAASTGRSRSPPAYRPSLRSVLPTPNSALRRPQEGWRRVAACFWCLSEKRVQRIM